MRVWQVKRKVCTPYSYESRIWRLISNWSSLGSLKKRKEKKRKHKVHICREATRLGRSTVVINIITIPISNIPIVRTYGTEIKLYTPSIIIIIIIIILLIHRSYRPDAECSGWAQLVIFSLADELDLLVCGDAVWLALCGGICIFQRSANPSTYGVVVINALSHSRSEVNSTILRIRMTLKLSGRRFKGVVPLVSHCLFHFSSEIFLS